MSYSTPGPLRHIDRHGRLDASGEVPDGGYSGADRALRAIPSRSRASEAEILGFGMKLFLASLTMIFGATFAAYGIIWWRNRADWQGAVDSGEVIRLAAATVLLVIADVAAARAFRQESDQPRPRFQLTRLTLIIASIYVVSRASAGSPHRPGDPDGTDPAHGGVPLPDAHGGPRGARHRRGGRQRHRPRALHRRARPPSGSLQMLYQYWRFLTVMWVAVLALLFGM